jgi:hypothetical protein
MRSGPVVVLGIRAEDALQVTPPEDEDVIDALSTDRAHPSFHDGVRPRRANWRPHHAEPIRPEYLKGASIPIGGLTSGFPYQGSLVEGSHGGSVSPHNVHETGVSPGRTV